MSFVNPPESTCVYFGLADVMCCGGLGRWVSVCYLYKCCVKGFTLPVKCKHSVAIFLSEVCRRVLQQAEELCNTHHHSTARVMRWCNREHTQRGKFGPRDLLGCTDGSSGRGGAETAAAVGNPCSHALSCSSGEYCSPLTPASSCFMNSLGIIY